MVKLHEHDLYIIEVTTENTDHWKGRSEGYSKLLSLGATELRWFSGSDINQHSYYARCSDDCLCLIKLAGYIVKANVTEKRIESVKGKIQLSLSTLGFSKSEVDEVDVKKIFHEIIDNYKF